MRLVTNSVVSGRRIPSETTCACHAGMEVQGPERRRRTNIVSPSKPAIKRIIDASNSSTGSALNATRNMRLVRLGPGMGSRYRARMITETLVGR
jgi:hypothetical protein